MSIDTSAETPTLFKSAEAFEAWLAQHHAASTGLWLKIAKPRGRHKVVGGHGRFSGERTGTDLPYGPWPTTLLALSRAN
jgi:hypothetical protein